MLDLGGFRDFWGKKLGRVLGSLAEDLSPIAMNQASGMRKLFQSARDVPLSAKWEAYGKMNKAVRGARRAAEGVGGVKPYTLGDYFSGLNVEDYVGGSKPRFRGSQMIAASGALPDAVRQRRMAWRLGIPGAIVGGAATQALVGDNFISDTVGAGMTAGAVIGGTSMMARFGGRGSAFAALGILGMSGVNALRRGDQWGPF